MKILILSKYFFPSIGGLEAIAWVCLNEFTRQGNDVRLITETPEAISNESSFQIFRKPNHREIVRHLHWCDVAFHNDAAIRYLPALLQSAKPYVVYMSGYIYPKSDGLPKNTPSFALKRRLLPLGFRLLLAKATKNIAACAAVSSANQTPSQIIPNPFDPSEFGPLPDVARDKTFLFAGRIVSIKGVDDIIRALAILRDNKRLQPTITVAGPGVFSDTGAETPFGSELLILARSLGVRDQLLFTGAQSKDQLRRLMNEHRVLLVPSKWNEPIGIVSLEAIASGCMVIGTNGGGLAVSIGPCGLTYPNGNAVALAECMANVLSGKADLSSFVSHASSHLENYLPEKVCGEILEVLKAAI